MTATTATEKNPKKNRAEGSPFDVIATNASVKQSKTTIAMT